MWKVFTRLTCASDFSSESGKILTKSTLQKFTEIQNQSDISALLDLNNSQYFNAENTTKVLGNGRFTR
jgi:hypothetical protein